MMIPTIDAVATGENINRLRIERDLTVADMQDVLGFSTPQAIYKWLNGKNLPTIDNLVILADMLNVSVSEIIVLK